MNRRKYEILQVGSTKLLIKKRDESEKARNECKVFVTKEKLFDAYLTAHEAIGHKSRDLMIEELKKKQANFAMWALKSNYNIVCTRI